MYTNSPNKTRKTTLTTGKVPPVWKAHSDGSNDEAHKAKYGYCYGVQRLVVGHGCMTQPTSCDLLHNIRNGWVSVAIVQLFLTSVDKHIILMGKSKNPLPHFF